MGFYDTYSTAFENSLSALDTLSNATLTQQIIHSVVQERYHR